MNINKICQNTDIPIKIVKFSADLFDNYIFRNFNYCLEKCEFPCVIKHADVVAVRNKKLKNDKANYRLVKALPILSKIHEKILYQQLHVILILFFYQRIALWLY